MIPKNVLHDVDMATDFRNDVLAQYHVEKQNHNVTSFMKYLNHVTYIMNKNTDNFIHKYGWSDAVFNVNATDYQKVKRILLAHHMTVSEYIRQIINAVANNKIPESKLKTIAKKIKHRKDD